jgi:general secretion pathway protein A
MGQAEADEPGSRRMAGSDWLHDLVPSRREVFDRVLALVRGGRDGPVLVTGESGAGKSWLVRALAQRLPADWQSLSVDVWSAMTERDLLQSIILGMGAAAPVRLGQARMRLQALLRDEAREGRHWLLVVDDAHRSSQAVWEAIEDLANSLSAGEGFSAIVLLGRTPLARKLRTRPLTWLSTRLSAHVHLMPLDLDEARELLGGIQPSALLSAQRLEELHRDAGGNPRRLLRLAGFRVGPPRAALGSEGVPPPGRDVASLVAPLAEARLARAAGSADHRESAGQTGSLHDSSEQSIAPPLVPSKPPIRLEDGLIEVGWVGDIEAEFEEPVAEPVKPQGSSKVGTTPPAEEAVDDRYAALQSWKEWRRNQEAWAGQAAGAPEPQVDPARDEPVAPAEASEGATASSSAEHASSLPGHVRAETQHDFAPYSQLFTRLRQSRRPGG